MRRIHWPSLVAVLSLVVTCERRDASPANVAAVEPNQDPTVPSCLDRAQPLPDTLVETDADEDGRVDRIEIFSIPDLRYPVVARWGETNADQPREAVWAVASELVVNLAADDKELTDRVTDSFRQRLDRQDLEVTPLGSERTFLIGVSPLSPNWGDFGARGEVFAALDDLRSKNAGRATVEPNYLVFPDIDPNDHLFDNQEGELRAIRAPQAWNTVTGRAAVRIAVIDSGIELTHPAFVGGNVEVVPAPPGTPHSDLVEGDDDPQDELDHGTYCAAIAGAPGNDSTAMTGVNWEVTLLPVKLIDEHGCGTSAHAAAAVDYAIRNRADVISASWGGLGHSKTLRSAIRRANTAGILFVASAGNVGHDLDSTPYFPASFGLPNMLVVGAAHDSGSPVHTSGFGRRTVHLTAPGAAVFSAVRQNLPTGRRLFPYADEGGTSPAVAFVSGAIALLKARDRALPAAMRLDAAGLRCRILQSTARKTALRDFSCSAGMLDLENAVALSPRLRAVCGC